MRWSGVVSKDGGRRGTQMRRRVRVEAQVCPVDSEGGDELRRSKKVK